jgi:hypothetical protein
MQSAVNCQVTRVSGELFLDVYPSRAPVDAGIFRSTPEDRGPAERQTLCNVQIVDMMASGENNHATLEFVRVLSQEGVSSPWQLGAITSRGPFPRSVHRR